MVFPFKKRMTIDESQEESERLDSEITVEQKRLALKKLKAAGLNYKTFGSWSEIWHWFKSH